jgi:hypothetical protein
MEIQQKIKPEEMLKIQQIGREMPELWIEQFFGVKLYDRQAEIARGVFKNSRTVARSCRGAGKSFVSAGVVLCFLYNFMPSTVITTAPTFRQVESILWREISGLKGRAKIPLDGNLTATRLELSDNWFAIGMSTDQPERFQGFHNRNVLVIGDEASGLPEEVYTAMENPLSTGNAHQLLIGNPTQPTGGFRRAFDSEIYEKVHISAFDTPNFTTFGIMLEDIRNDTWKDKIGDKELPYPNLVTPQWVSERFKEWGEGSYHFQVYVMGEFPQSGVNTLFRLQDIEAAMRREVGKDGNKVAALDISRYGDDETVFGERVGDSVLPLKSWSHQDTTYTAGRTLRFLKEGNHAGITIDAIGVGGGVSDMLKQEINLRAFITEFNAGGQAKDKEMFGNRRAECYWNLEKLCEDGGCSLPKDEKLKAQLCDIRYKYDSKGRIWIESKEEMRARGSKSPDRADVVMMLFSSEATHGNSFRCRQRSIFN